MVLKVMQLLENIVTGIHFNEHFMNIYRIERKDIFTFDRRQ